MSFALDRYFTPFELTGEKFLLLERLDEILKEVLTLSEQSTVRPSANAEKFIRDLDLVKNVLTKLRKALTEVCLHAEDSD